MQPTLPDAATFILPILGSIVIHYLKSRSLATWKNALIAGFFLLVVAIFCVWLGDGFVPGNARGSVLAVLAYVMILMQGALKMIMLYFEELASPLASDPPANPNPIRVRTSYIDPSSIPPRASRE